MKILFFAQIRDFAGRSACDVPIDRAIGIEELWQILNEQFPGIDKFRSSTRLARNEAFSSPDEIFLSDDEVALLPPVSGG